jgi:hypothetical protein
MYVTLGSIPISSHWRSAMSRSRLDRPAPFAKGGCCADPGMGYTYSRLEQGYEEERVFTQAVGKAHSAITADANVSPSRSAPQQVEVIVDLERILQGHACFYLIMQDELVVLAHQWFQTGAHLRYRELSTRIQFMEQGLSWHEDRLYLSYVKKRARPATYLVVVPRRDSQVERHSNGPAFHHFLHDVTENDWYVSSLRRGLDHEAAAQRLDMRGLNAVPHFFGRDGCADECIDIKAYVQKVLHVPLSQVRPNIVAERAEELRQVAFRLQKLLDVAP